MSTLRQIEANRRNAQNSSGPTSVTGKAVSSLNSLKTGIHAKSLVLPFENRANLEELIEECYRHYHPTTPDARFVVDDLIRCEWTLRRFDNAETQTWQYQNEDKYRDPEKYPLGKSACCNPNSFSKLQYRLEATPAPAPAPVVEPADPPFLSPSPQTTSPQIGFVPSSPTAAPFQPAPVALSPGLNRPASAGTGHAQIR